VKALGRESGDEDADEQLNTLLKNYEYAEIIFEPLKISEILGGQLPEGQEDEAVFSIYGRIDLSA